MNQKSILSFIVVAIFLFGCTNQEAKTSGLLEYKNADLGISFKYPSNFKVYQADKNSLNIDSGYENKTYPSARISIRIEKIDTKKKSLQEIESMVNPLSSELKYLESLTTNEGREQIKRELEVNKNTHPELYKSFYGDKTVEEATDESIKDVERKIQIWKENKTYQVINKGNYDLITVNSADIYYPHYLLSDKGTFTIDHLQPYGDGTVIRGRFMVSEQEYTPYKEKFDSIIDSIKII